jgi:hypothetical protein
MTTRIEGVVEFFEIGDGYEDCQCARCGSSVDFEECSDCGGEGTHDFAEDDPIQYGPSDVQPCGTCEGSGGWWMCLSSEEFCKAHPLPGREHIRFKEVA